MNKNSHLIIIMACLMTISFVSEDVFAQETETQIEEISLSKDIGTDSNDTDEDRNFLEVLKDEVMQTIRSIGNFWRAFPDTVSNVLSGWGSGLDQWWGIFVLFGAIAVALLVFVLTGGLQKSLDAFKERIS